MKKINLLVIFFLSLVISSCKYPETKILIAGDSWAALVCLNKSLNESLKNHKMKFVRSNDSCPLTTRIGIHAEDWINSEYDNLATKELKDKSVKVLYLSLGGNDFLNKWNKSMSAEKENEIFSEITEDIAAVIAKYEKLRPDVKIILSGYDFPRFTSDNKIENYREIYERLGSPSALEINAAILRLSEFISQVSNGRNIFYIQHYGLMHYYFGNTENGLQPGATLPPHLISKFPEINNHGGDINLHSDPAAMLKVEVENAQVADAFHLSKKGYRYIADHVVEMYLKTWYSEQVKLYFQ